jgi:hypothetical protein
MQNYNFAPLLYGCGTWPIKFMEEHRLTVYKNRMLMKMCGPKREEVIGGSWKFGGKTSGKDPLRRPRHREYKTLRWLFKNYYGSLHWINLAQDKDRWLDAVNMAMDFVSQNADYFLRNWGNVSFSKRVLFPGVSERVNYLVSQLVFS